MNAYFHSIMLSNLSAFCSFLQSCEADIHASFGLLYPTR